MEYKLIHKEIRLQENAMRIEFILKKSQKIKEVFKSTLVSDLTDEKINQFYYQQFTRLFEELYRKWQIENGNQLRNMITYHKGKNKRYWKSNLLRKCSNKEQIDQIPLLLDVKYLLTPVKALEKDGHYQRVTKGILEQRNYNYVARLHKR